jgi:hypothetical protein
MKITSFLPLILFYLVSCSNTTEQKAGSPETISASGDPIKSAAPNKVQTVPLNDTYCNNRYGFCISFPNEIVTLEHESASGDGAYFFVGNNYDFLIVFGRANPDPAAGKFNLKKELSNEMSEFLKDSVQHKATVTYNTQGKDFYVFSGIKDDKIFYQKAIDKGDDIAIAIFQYDKQQKEKFDVIVAAMAKSFK